MAFSNRRTLVQHLVAYATPVGPQSLAALMGAAIHSLRSAERVCVFTGAGLCFDGKESELWKAQKSLLQQSSATVSLDTQFQSADATQVWQRYNMHRDLVRGAAPSVVHRALALLLHRVSHCRVVTQTVDDLLERAGVQNPIRLRGSLMQMRCSNGCPKSTPVPLEKLLEPPRCNECGAYMRPDLTLPGESLALRDFDEARECAIGCDVFLSIGASGVVQPEASLPSIAATHGATVIVVDASMEGQRLSSSVLPLEGFPSAIVPRLVTEVLADRKGRRGLEQNSYSPG